MEPKYIQEPKKLPNGKPNPAFYEEMLEAVCVVTGGDNKLSTETCLECNEAGHAMYNYKTKKWYIECACEKPIEIIRDTRQRTIAAWNVNKIINQMEKKGEL